ncbi:MAG: ABC transporter ATP-binding protein [Bacillales bacterium]|nr:ABC transporter ATP-binding protein [Bacillales bacterium]MDY6003643.1 ABC transporter ATP-binding protein [Bacilli bacterium]
MEQKQEKILEVKNLRISFKTNTGTVKAVRGINFSLYKGRTLAIVGESGSGKSVTSKAILGILANNKIVEDGQILFDGKNLLNLSEDKFTKIRGTKISMIFQDPLSALNPIMKVGKQLTEAMFLQHKATVREAKEFLARFNKEAGYYKTEENDALFFKAFKTKQRFETEEEAYEALNADQFLPFIEKVVINEADIYVHNLDFLRESLVDLKEKYFNQKADEVDFEKFALDFKNTNKLVKACKTPLELESDDLIDVYPDVIWTDLEQIKSSKQLKEHQEQLLNQYNASDIFDVPAQIRIKEREVIVPIETYYQSIIDTTEQLLNHIDALIKDYSVVDNEYVNEVLHQYVKQFVVSKSILTASQTKARAIELMTEVGIPDPERRFYQYPFEFSGGMRQRIVIAIALSGDPKILICDEPTTALDVTIQAQILELINKLKVEKNLSIIFITHDLGVVANMANDIAVMYAGKIVEYGTVYDIFYDPRHPYTWALLGSMPDLDTKGKLDAIPGTPPNMLLPPRGDAFAARNQYALALDYEQEPPFFQISDTHFAKTWLLHESAPDVEAPKTVSARIANSLKENPRNIPHYDLAKNSILAKLEKRIQKGGK